jgi:nucleoside phosphorylase
MNTKDVNILFWDDESNYKLERTQSNLGIFDGISSVYKNIYRFWDVANIATTLKDIADDEPVFILCHIHINGLKGYEKFKLVLNKYPNVKNNFYYVSSNREAHKQFFDEKGVNERIFTYSSATEEIKNAQKILTKKELLNIDSAVDLVNHSINQHFDYAIITALYENEFEAIEKLFDVEKEINTDTYPYKVLKLKNSDKKVVACFATKTGMVEASIIATEMIHRFTPKYILMPGVCGGSEKTKFGSVIVAEKVFLFQKGKLSDLKEETEEGVQLTKLYYNESVFDKTKVKDSQGNNIDVMIEKFEGELENIDIDTNLVSKLKPHLKEIEQKINEPYAEKEKIEVQLEPMACSIMVINKEDYFNKNILTKDRDTKAVEMESYGVARAAKIANGGKTKWLIFKSVMDKTQLKNDDYKAKAAYTSAQFMKQLFELNII